MIRQLQSSINDLLTLQQGQFSFKESDFIIFKHDHSQRLLDNFFDIALLGITVAFVFRVIFLGKNMDNPILELFLPFAIMMLILLFYYINKNTSQMKHYFHIVLIPLVGLLTARKTISQKVDKFYLNESFASWLIMMTFGSFSSPQQWYQVVGINFLCFFAYIMIVFKHYGLQGVGNDFFVHITTTIIFSACLIRMNELNLRNSFNLLSLSKIQEKKWQSVLTLLTDGVLIMQHSENEQGILLINQSLQNIFGKQMKIDEIKDQENNDIQLHTCGKNTNNKEIDFQNYMNTKEKIDSQKLKNLNKISGGINITLSFNKSLCNACEFELKQQAEFQKQKNKINKQEKITNKIRFNEKKVGPQFDDLFRTVQFKIVYSEKKQSGLDSSNNKNQSKEVQFMNDFICKQLDYFQKHHPQGYSEHFLLKLCDPNRIIELNIIKLDSEQQVLFLFKEVSIYNRLSKARTTEKFSNILINSIAHNLFTPLNAMIQLTKSMSDTILGINELADKNVQMIGICLQQLVFTTHNILEMSKIKQGRFMPNKKPISIVEKALNIFEFFKDDMKFRETEYELKIQDRVKNFKMILDDSRFSIVLYNLISNGVKHTSGGLIKVSVKILSSEDFNKKREKIKKQKQDDINQNKNSIFNIQNSHEDEISFSSSEQKFVQNGQKDYNEDELINEKNVENHYLQISVCDTGVGMDHDQKKKCFKLFGNLKIKQDVNQGGMGLGLASASLICKALDGELYLIRSDKNEGSKFKFILPVTIGNLIIPKQISIGSSQEENSSDNESSQSKNQKNKDNFEKKKAQIIENIRNKQQKIFDQGSDESEYDESFESDSEQDAILEEYRVTKTKDKIQSCDVNKESSFSDTEFQAEEMENELSDQITNKNDSFSKKQIYNICTSKLQINNEFSSQNINNVNNMKESSMMNQDTFKQQSIFDENNNSNYNGFTLKQNAQILKQNFYDYDEIEKQIKVLQQLNPFLITSNPGQTTINTLEMKTTNYIEKKNDSDSPSSPKSSKIYKGKIDDSFINFLNSSNYNYQIPLTQQSEETKQQIDRHYSNIQQNQQININSLTQYFEKRAFTMNNVELKHYKKNPLVKYLQKQSQFMKQQFPSQIDEISQKQTNKQSLNRYLSLDQNVSQNYSMQSIDQEIEILLNSMNSAEIFLNKNLAKRHKTAQAKNEGEDYQISENNKIFNIVPYKKSKFYYQTIQQKKSKDKNVELSFKSSNSKSLLSPIQKGSNDSHNLKPILEQSYYSSKNELMISKQCIESYIKEQQEQFQSKKKKNSQHLQSNMIEQKQNNQSNGFQSSKSSKKEIVSMDSLKGKFNFKYIGSQANSNQIVNQKTKLKFNTQIKNKSKQKLNSLRNTHEILINSQKQENAMEHKKSIKQMNKSGDNNSNQIGSKNERQRTLNKQKSYIQKSSIIQSNQQSSQQQKNYKSDGQKISQIINATSQQQQTQPQVLIVDDTVFNIQILQMIFQQKYNIVVDQAVSGEEAIMKCKKRIDQNIESYKMILMDINMPEMDGVVATSNIRQFNDIYVNSIQQKDYIIVAHTAIPEDQFGDYKVKGFDGFLQKPIDHDQLQKFLKKVHLK